MKNGTVGTVYVVSAASGAGKTSLLRALIAEDSGLAVSVSHTTRDPRPAEQDGVDYHFVDDPTFVRLIEQEAFVEHAHVLTGGMVRVGRQFRLSLSRAVMFC